MTDIIHNDFEWEKNFAASIAVDRFETWEEYDCYHRLLARFKPEQIAKIHDVFHRWKAIDAGLKKAIVTPPDSN